MDLPKDLSLEIVHVEECVLHEITDEEGSLIYRVLIKQTRASAMDYYLSSTILNKKDGKKRFLQMKKVSVSKYLEYLDEKNDAFYICKIKKQSFVWKKRTISIEDHHIGDKTINILKVGKGKDDKYDDVEFLPEFLHAKVQKIITEDSSYDVLQLYKKSSTE